jgi:hypothetical protein
MRALLTILTTLALVLPCSAGTANFPHSPWTAPESLPLQFRNHCFYTWWQGPYCADHCGLGYQFYYCSNHSYGCCHLGLGYCDWNGALRCAPSFLL